MNQPAPQPQLQPQARHERLPPVAGKTRPARLALRVALALSSLVLAGGLLLVWLLGSAAGSRALLQGLAGASGGAFTCSGIAGTLGRELRLDQFALRAPGLRIDGSGVHLRWQPAALLRGRLQIDTLEASTLRIASAQSGAAARLPAGLALPLTIELPQLALGRLQIAGLDADNKPAGWLTLSAISASLRYAQQRYQGQAALDSLWGRLQLEARLADARPFVLNGKLNWQGQAYPALPRLNLQGQLDGSLETVRLALQAPASPLPAVSAVPALQGQASATFTPFAAPFLRSLQADLLHANPAAWQAAAPQADLRIRAALAASATETGILSGELELGNARPGSLDHNALPLLALKTRLSWAADRIDLSRLQLQLPGQGAVSGHALWQWGAGPRGEAQLTLAGVDLRQIDSRLHASKIRGSLQAHSAAAHAVALQAHLSDGVASLQAEGVYQAAPALLTFSKLDLRADDSHLQGQGDIAFGGAQAFHFKGSLLNFDPARWLAAPAGRLQAQFSGQGQLQPRLQLQASLPQLQGHYAGQALQAKLDLRWLAGQQLQLNHFDLHWGKNALTAHGAWGADYDSLQFSLDAPELSAFNPLTAPLQLTLGGSLQAQARLQGRFNEPAGTLATEARQLQIVYRQRRISIAGLNGKLALGGGSRGQFEGEISAQHVGGDWPGLSFASGAAAPGESDKLAGLSLQLTGRRDAHSLTLDAAFPGRQKLNLQASGGLQSATKNSAWSWNGLLQAFTLSGKPDLRLQSAATLQVSPQTMRLGGLQLHSELGSLALASLEWTPESLSSAGSISAARVLAIAGLLKPQYALDGNLQVDGQWQLQFKDNVRGEIHLQRRSGDLRIVDTDGAGIPVALGMRALEVDVQLGGLIAGSAHERLALQLKADGSRLGQWQLQANSALSRLDGQWRVAPDAALDGSLNAAIPDLQWLGPSINPGLVLKGKLNVDARLAGSIAQPHYLANLSGRELELAFASEGLLLPNGSLEAQLEDRHLKLNQLQFFNTVTSMPRHAQFQGVEWLGEKGEFHASGEIDIGQETGSIRAQWQRFPLLQRKDRWLLVSGQASIVEANNIWSLTGKLDADGAYFKLPKAPPPSLSSDVIVSRAGKERKTNGGENGKKGVKTRVDVSLDMGPHFVFVGRGLDTGLAGSIRLRANDGAPLQASGSIRTVGGVYEGYGQQLAIERGILNFQGSPANPGLNIRALRQGLAVEAGVEVVGSVAAPQVRLVSEPAVPDAEKLSWLVLGRGSDQLAGSDASLLMSAASAIFGGDGSRNVPRDIVQGLGFDEFAIGAAGNGSSSRLPGQTIAGSTGLANGATTSGEQVLSIGKRLMPGLVLSVERGLSDASGAVKLSWQLTRRISVTGRTGSESAVDAYYTFSFH
ncbi:MAG: translocation/assembly module TamB domain-containing protein [Burkholderiales bacterium]|nr:translocation/assembly module TamB domain-containing protein [Burkholderiales bacterium]